MSGAPTCIYQDENVCILDPKDPRSKTKGVPILHVIGYMEAVGGEYGQTLFEKVKKEGLKSSGQLLTEKGVELPTTAFNENEETKEYNHNASLRRSYLEANKDHFNRIFFRPPSTTPFVYDGTGFKSAGPWRRVLGSPREIQALFGGKSLGQIASHTAEIGNISAGIVMLRVDPDQTFVYYEALKNATGDQNKATGVSVPRSRYEKESKAARFEKSRIRLSDFLDQLEQNLKGSPPEMKPYNIKPNQIVEPDWEVMITTPILPPSVFASIVSTKDLSVDEDTEGDKAMRKYDNDLWKKRMEEGRANEWAVTEFFQAFNPVTGELDRLGIQLSKLMEWEVKPKGGKFKTEEAKREAIRNLRDELKTKLDAFVKALQAGAQEKRTTWTQIQRNLAAEKTKHFQPAISFVQKTIRTASAFLGNAKGGARTRKGKHKAGQTRRRR